ncbi:formylglycine-generating enzyme family protein [Armatimonas rosea]|uniref:Formylglycine-generating enzyme required for sulfatase activity n=1 Tax=Armatimonas rosea TaxID=685828 RepID=A0A7W9SVU7_ARMRO|nr:SUMF1/EgtB/PvdO family nonheme iron enzyme [Armatimonas rosea]MBB6053786.1 formylglycine-generating enzyme required for sulfatase activity [Armatimonas rosea]
MSFFSAPRTLEQYKSKLVSVPLDCDSAFYIGRVPVTVAMWEEFCEATNFSVPWSMKVGGGMAHKDRFVVGVSWEDAQAYLQWAGMILPTTQQWELAVNKFHIGSGIYEWCQDALDEITAAQIEAEWQAFREEYPCDVIMGDELTEPDEEEIRLVAEEIAREIKAKEAAPPPMISRATRGPDWRTKRSPFYGQKHRSYELGFRGVVLGLE